MTENGNFVVRIYLQTHVCGCEGEKENLYSSSKLLFADYIWVPFCAKIFI